MGAAPAIVAAVAACIGLAARANAQPVRDPVTALARDVSKPAAVGTGSIAGAVVSDDANPHAIRRVRVTISSADRAVGRMAITDDAGRFNFTDLPAGRYQLMAVKRGYATISYGAKRANRPGTAIVLADGQKSIGLTVKLPRGGVITGLIQDHAGEPFAGAPVQAMRSAIGSGGQRQLVPAGSAQTDDRGAYRIWGLPAGEYTVLADATYAGSFGPSDAITRVSDADVKRAMIELAGGSSVRRQDAAAAPKPGARQSVGYAPVFYPGTFVASQATPLRLAAGEERSGVDFSIALVQTARIEGTIAAPEGINPTSLMLQLVVNNPAGIGLDSLRRTWATPNGSFTFAGVTPGVYTIIARGALPGRTAVSPPPGRAAAAPQPTHYAMTEVSVDGEDVTGVSLALEAGFTVAGRVQFDGTARPPDLTRLRLGLTPVQTRGEVSLGVTQISPEPDGTFSLAGVPPGRYRLTAFLPTARGEPAIWQLKSSTMSGRDSLDTPVELGARVDDAVITFTDRLTELNGMVQDPNGQPAPEYQVVVFSADRSHWLPQSRRIRSVKPAVDGKYIVPGLPPGDYLLTAVPDIEPGEMFDPAFLDQLSRVAFKITLSEGEKKTQDLRLAAQRP